MKRKDWRRPSGNYLLMTISQALKGRDSSSSRTRSESGATTFEPTPMIELLLLLFMLVLLLLKFLLMLLLV